MKEKKVFKFTESMYGESELVTFTKDPKNFQAVGSFSDGHEFPTEISFYQLEGFNQLNHVRESLTEQGIEVYSLAEVDEEREAFKEELLELLEEDEMMANGYEDEVIYEIDDIKVYGAFEYGSRGVDHNILLSEDVDWEDIINWGTVVVPESMTYISDEPIEEYEDMGYENLPTDNNHIMGYSSSSVIDNDFDMEL